MEEIEYNGYKIISESYQDEETGKWVPSAVVLPTSESSPNSEMPMSWEREFDTRQEAEDFATEGAQFYIDNLDKHAS
ncbi:MAG: hypothetical protein R3251_03735 [Candidatus Spechtbacterales bacterium]|nr:hypothetical protein [Candidatus Spechtbacterales bacterium]